MSGDGLEKGGVFGGFVSDTFGGEAIMAVSEFNELDGEVGVRFYRWRGVKGMIENKEDIRAESCRAMARL